MDLQPVTIRVTGTASAIEQFTYSIARLLGAYNLSLRRLILMPPRSDEHACLFTIGMEYGDMSITEKTASMRASIIDIPGVVSVDVVLIEETGSTIRIVNIT